MRVFALGLVFLGVCVFAWGLRYKLSLYTPPDSASRCMPAAKLLTNRDRSVQPAIQLRPASDSGVPAGLTGFVLALLGAAGFYRKPGFRAVAPVAPMGLAIFRVQRSFPFSIRPPPAVS